MRPQDALTVWRVGWCLLGALLAAAAIAAEPGAEQQDQARQAAALCNEGMQRYRQGDTKAAVGMLREAVAGQRRLYPAETHPQGHPELARSLHMLGWVLTERKEYSQGEAALQEAIAMRRKLYPVEKYPQGDPALAQNLLDLGVHYERRGDWKKAVQAQEEALAMRRKVYAPDRFPNGHADLAWSLSNVAHLRMRDDPVRARRLLEEAVAVWRKLYPESRFPDGTWELAGSLTALGDLLVAQKEYGKGEDCYLEALVIRRRLYSKEKYPSGHWEIVDSLDKLSRLFLAQKKQAEAIDYLERAVAMRQRLSAQPAPQLAVSLNLLASLLAGQGQYGDAVRYGEQALAMWRRIYPADRFPRGHLHLAMSLSDLGRALKAKGEARKALPYLEEAVAMYHSGDTGKGAPLELAMSLSALADILEQREEYRRALPHREEALALYRRLYPAEKFPYGHPVVAAALNELAGALGEVGEHSRALGAYDQALAIYENFSPRGKYPAIAPLLSNRASIHGARGDHKRVREDLTRALALFRELYPPEKYPAGEPNLIRTLNNMGTLMHRTGKLEEALRYYREALALEGKRYPAAEYPRGHPDLAVSLHNIAGVLQDQGEHSEARKVCEEALAMRRRLYPPDEYPRGHPKLASSLLVLSQILRSLGEYGRARAASEEAVDIGKKLYPGSEYPDGHPALAGWLSELAVVYREQGDADKALASLQQVLAMREKLYPPQSYPRGHADLAESLSVVGALLAEVGKSEEALAYLEKALEMQQQLYPEKDYPHGHPSTIGCLTNLGTVHWHRGQYGLAARFFERSVRQYRKLFPEDRYPRGSPELAHGLANAAMAYLPAGNPEQALKYAEQAMDMNQDLFEVFGGQAAEAEALNFAASLPVSEGLLLSPSAQLNTPAERVYGRLWRSKAATARLLQHRQGILHHNADPETRRLAARLLEARRALARALLTPAAARGGPDVEELTRNKEELERRLAEHVPSLARRQRLERQGPDALQRRLPAHSLCLDFYRYHHTGKGEQPARHYGVFVVRPGEPVVRVELGPAEPIDRAVRAWRAEITAGSDRSGEAPRTLRRLVWEPLARHVPPETEMVWLCPQGELTALPWAALPGRHKDGVLLEDHALAVAPSGPLLLSQLAEAPAQRPAGKEMLVAGGVDYDQAPREEGGTAGEQPVAVPPTGPRVWKALQGTERERRLVKGLAGEAAGARIRDLHGRDASAGRLLRDLPGVRWAHLATHGFFADEKVRSALRLDEKQFQQGLDRAAAGARNPLVLSGLVLAGANREQDAGIVTAEAIAGLDLTGLEVAVLSACETGLGEVAGGEGVFGLQRAFHLAGARSVVASLWAVDDEATAALMGLFYRYLWVENRSPADALRRAQLYLYRHPEEVATLAHKRAPDFAAEEEVTAAPAAVEKVEPRRQHARVSQWAAFVLSGAGR